MAEARADGRIMNNFKTTEWNTWIQSFEIYLMATGADLEADHKKIAKLLYNMGKNGLQIFNSFDVDIKSTTYKEVITLFNKHCIPKKNLTMERHAFFNTKQNEQMSMEEFVTELNNKSQNCEFEKLRSSLVLNIFISNMNPRYNNVKEKLLQSDNLDLDRAVDIATTMVISQKDAMLLNAEVHAVAASNHHFKERGRSSSQSSNQSSRAREQQPYVRSPSQMRRTSPSRQLCQKCGQIHRHTCPAMRVKCNTCHKIGHFSRYCFKNKSVVSVVNQTNRNKSVVSVVSQTNRNKNCNEVYLQSVTKSQNNKQNVNSLLSVWNLNLIINHKTVTCILDTGAMVNVMSYNTYKSLKISNRIINDYSPKLESFSGNNIPVKGHCILSCQYNDNKIANIDFIITPINCRTIIGLQTCQELCLIQRIYTTATVNNNNYVNNMLKVYNDVFQGLGCLSHECHITVDQNAVPKINASRRVPFKLHNRLKEELDRMEKLRVVQKVTKPTSWVNSMVIVEKPNKNLRICLDPRNLNQAIKRSHFQFPTLEELRYKLNGANIFSKLDANSGFWMLKLDEESVDLCTFQTPFGRYQFLRLPYGINSAPEIFFRVMTEIFSDIEGVLIFVDDFLVFGENEEIHNQRLEKVLQRARDVNLKFNMDKCNFSQSEIKYLGHIFSNKGVKPDDSKIKAIKEMPKPMCVKDLQRFLGMINYLGPFIKNLSSETEIFRNLLKKDSLWSWDANHDLSFKRLQNIICTSPVLAHYDINKSITLSVDASQSAVGAVILQENKPLAFGSKSLTQCQQNYAQIEKELYAILFGCQKFHQYLYGQLVQVETDHKPLVSLFKKSLSDVPIRLQRMMMALQKYNLNVTYVPGKYMYVADALSRAPLPDTEITDVEKEMQVHVNLLISSLAVSKDKLHEIKVATNQDVTLGILKKYYLNGWPATKNKCEPSTKPYWNMQGEIHVVNDLVFKGSSLVIPNVLRPVMLNKIHESHQGISKSKYLARNSIYWPNMNSDIQNKVDQCSICNQFKPNNSKEPLIPYSITTFPWERVGIDLLQFNNTIYLVVMDYYSKYIEIVSLHSGYTANLVVTHLKAIFARHGIPLQIVSDNGPPFTSAIFKNFIYDWDIEHVTTSPNFPQSNGQAESGVKIVKNILKKCHESKTDIYMALLHYRNTPKDNLPSPSQLLMSRQLRVNIPIKSSQLKPRTVSFNEYQKCMRKKQNNMKKSYNTHTKELPPLKTGDSILFKKSPQSHWIPATVVEILSNCPRSYIVKTLDGATYRRNRKHLMLDKSKINTNNSRCNSEPYQSILTQNDNNDFEQQTTSSNAPDKDLVPVSVTCETGIQHQTTKSGRQVNKPKRFTFSEFD